MDVIREIFVKLDNVLSKYLQPIIDEITGFLASGEYIIIGAVCFLVSIIVLVGLIRWLTKKPKLFILIVILLGIVVGAKILIK